MTMKNLIENWKFPDRSAERIQITLRIPVTDHARLHALKEVYPTRSVNDMISDILKVALDEIVENLPIYRADEDDVISWHEENYSPDMPDSCRLAIGDPIGPGMRYLAAYRRILSSKSTDDAGV